MMVICCRKQTNKQKSLPFCFFDTVDIYVQALEVSGSFPPILLLLVFLKQNFGRFPFVLPVLSGVVLFWVPFSWIPRYLVGRRAGPMQLGKIPREEASPGTLGTPGTPGALPSGTLLLCSRLPAGSRFPGSHHQAASTLRLS